MITQIVRAIAEGLDALADGLERGDRRASLEQQVSTLSAMLAQSGERQQQRHEALAGRVEEIDSELDLRTASISTRLERDYEDLDARVSKLEGTQP